MVENPMSDSEPTRSSAPLARASPVHRHIQFTLRQLLLFTALTALLLSSIMWGGALGAVLLTSIASLVALALALKSRNTRRALLAAGLLAACVFLLIEGSVVSIGDGQTPCPLTFAVVAEDDREVIAAATVRIREVRGRAGLFFRVESDLKNEPGIEGRTDGKGLVSLVYSYPTTSRESLFMHTCEVCFPWHWVQVSAAGYQSAVFDLRDLLGRRVSPRKFPLPPIELKLKRQGMHKNT